MRHRANWGSFVGGLALLGVAALFLVDALTPAHVPLTVVLPLLLAGLGLAAILGRRTERGG